MDVLKVKVGNEWVGIPAIASPTPPVTDVQVNGSSVVSNGVAEVPVANATTFGVAKVSSNLGVNINPEGFLTIGAATSSTIKNANTSLYPIAPVKQHEAVFYGLTKAAGVDMASSDNAVGTYTDAAKTAIRTMIGAGTSSISDIQINNTSVLSNGVANIPIANDALGVVKVISTSGISINSSNGVIQIASAPDSFIKAGENATNPIVSSNQHKSVFYGLAKAAGDSTQAASSNAVGTYTDAAKSAIRAMIEAGTYSKPSGGIPSTDLASAVTTSLGKADTAYQKPSGGIPATDLASGVIPSVPVTDVQVNGTSILSSGVANVPLASLNDPGAVKVNPSAGILITDDGTIAINRALDSQVKASTNGARPITPSIQDASAFYGLAKAAGDSTQAASSNAVGTYTNDAKSAIRTMIGAGTYSKPANGIPASDLASGVIPSVPVTDVQVNGTSVLNNGVANIPMANGTTPGVITISPSVSATGLIDDVDLAGNSYLKIYAAPVQIIKLGSNECMPITSLHQHESVFYGLAKAAGEDMASSSNAVGTYTDAAKSAIRTMLGAGTYSKPSSGIPASDLASGVIPSVSVTDVQVNGTSIVSNGVATIPIADSSNPGIVRINANGGTQILSSGTLALASAGETLIKAGTSQYKPITPLVQHMATFYGLATAAGDTTQSQSNNAVGTYTDTAKSAIKSMLGVTDLPAVTAADNGKVLMVVNGAWAVVSLSSANGVSF